MQRRQLMKKRQQPLGHKGISANLLVVEALVLGLVWGKVKGLVWELGLELAMDSATGLEKDW